MNKFPNSVLNTYTNISCMTITNLKTCIYKLSLSWSSTCINTNNIVVDAC